MSKLLTIVVAMVLLALPAQAQTWTYKATTDDFGVERKTAWVSGRSWAFVVRKTIPAPEWGWQTVAYWIPGDPFICPDAAVTFRFDQDKPRKSEWAVSDDRTALHVLDGGASSRDLFFQRLMTANKLIVKFVDGCGESMTQHIPLNGSEAAIKRVLE